MRVKTSVRRTQSEVRVFDRVFNDAKKSFGIKNNNEQLASTDSTLYAPFKRKRSIGDKYKFLL